MRTIYITLAVLALGCAVQEPNTMTVLNETSIREAFRPYDVRLKDQGLDPDRLVGFVLSLDARDRRKAIRVLTGQLPGMVGGLPETEPARRLEAAMMTAAEIAAHEKRNRKK